MDLEEITSLMENSYSPRMYAIKDDFYGIQYGDSRKEKKIKKVMLTVDMSLESIHYAIKNKCNLIISLFGLFNNSIDYLDHDLTNKLTLLSKFPISIFVLNSSYIAAEGGVSDTIMNAISLQLEKPFEIKNTRGIYVPAGRICSPISYSSDKKHLTMESLLNRIKNNLNMETINFVGNLNKNIKKACVIGGYDIFNGKDIEELIDIGCDCLIIGNIYHSMVNHVKDTELSLIEVSFYNSSVLALAKLTNILSLEYPYEVFLLFKSENPIKTFS